MDLQSSPAIEKIAKHGEETARISGYIYAEKKDATCFRLYPELSASPYYEIETTDVVDIIRSPRDDETQTVILRSDARVSLVARMDVSGKDLKSGGGAGWVPLRGALPPWADRLRIYLLMASAALLEQYVGTESIPGTGQSGHPGDDL